MPKVPPIDVVLEALAQGEGRHLDMLFEVLRIPSISTSATHAGDCRRAAAWFSDAFAAMGFACSLCETPGQPALIARRAAPGRPRLVYYGHYDVQPPEPLEAWHAAPFEPALREGPNGPCIIARGAADDKGQVLAWMSAFQAYLDTAGDMPADITVVLEGEEETGSPNFDHVLRTAGADLKAEAVIISDGTMWNAATPAITTSLRGLVYCEVVVTTALHDLHSGLFGGVAPNAALALIEILAGLKDGQGRILVPGIYDGVRDIPQGVAESWDGLNFSEAAFVASAGITRPAGEVGRSALERLWARPTADVNGMWSGYLGEGSKTIIPNLATAKLSFRLVPGQDPAHVVAGVRAFVAARCPSNATAEVKVLEAAPAVSMPQDSPWLRDAACVLDQEFGRPPVMIGCGGSLGAVESFQRLLGVPSLLFSFGLEDDRVHAPNEKFDLACFRHAARSHARLLHRWHERQLDDSGASR